MRTSPCPHLQETGTGSRQENHRCNIIHICIPRCCVSVLGHTNGTELSLLSVANFCLIVLSNCLQWKALPSTQDFHVYAYSNEYIIDGKGMLTVIILFFFYINTTPQPNMYTPAFLMVASITSKTPFNAWNPPSTCLQNYIKHLSACLPTYPT